MNVVDVIGQLINTTLVFSTALIFTALGGMYSERSGVVNIGLEGLMVSGAFAAAVATEYAIQAGLGNASPWIGLVAAAIYGVLVSLLHAVSTITFRADQTVVGVVINIFSLGLSLYLTKSLYDGSGQTPQLANVFHKWKIPYLSDIPLLGKAIFTAYPTTYIVIILAVVSYFVLFRTPFGLRLRAVGEHPSSADTVGISVTKYRYIGVLLSGALAGLGGATITLTTTSSFAHNTISGQGFIALAALIFGKWNPLGVVGAAMFFGLAQALRSFAQLFEFSKQIPVEFFYMLPYVLTLVVLAGAVGRSNAPSALGQPYDPAKR
ncbi:MULTISPECIES: ABC transporter permease [Bacillales]|jgi:simple sugar transport system permease protein|uniref:ABC transporter permease n=1 Tax=Bacillales TaxID=1385 RepID=UPI0006A7C55D|nr:MULTISPECIES: ABC transporter permease [Bacillales]OBZ15469.1 sugar ABC transporter permease [Bacillus sp. FJAT-26390]